MYLPEQALQGLRHNPNIEYVEPDARRYALAEVAPYGVAMVQADQVPSAPVAGDALVCIIDSGIRLSHEDFAGQPIGGTNDSGTGNWFEDDCGHGTHVAGTIAAATGNGLGVTSVAGNSVALHIVKVFTGSDCAWTFSSDLVKALDDCTAAGAQVVSMSLGGSFKSRTEDKAFQAAWSAGMLSIAAAGNDGNTRKSYPASYNSVVSVAAVDESSVLADFSQRNAAVEIAAPGVGVLSTYPLVSEVTVGAVSYAANQIEGAASGSMSGLLVSGGLCDSVGSWAGAVVLCERGAVSFFDKVNNGLSGGAAAVVIYNNEPGNFFGTLGDGVTLPIMGLSISQADGQALVAGALGQSANTFAGYGDDGYAYLNGTSMATPHVSAVAGLLWSQFPAATNADIRDAMNATAIDLGSAGRDDSFGYGLVQAKAAYDYLAGTGPDCSADGTCNAACAAGADPDCAAPDCSADGTCNAECAAGADPDCGVGPDCSADGTCNAECAAGADPDCELSCAPLGDSCSADSDCCGNKCKGKSGSKTCK